MMEVHHFLLLPIIHDKNWSLDLPDLIYLNGLILPNGDVSLGLTPQVLCELFPGAPKTLFAQSGQFTVQNIPKQTASNEAIQMGVYTAVPEAPKATVATGVAAIGAILKLIQGLSE